MIKLPESMKTEDVAEKAKQVLEEKVSVNVINQKKITKNQIAAMAVCGVACIAVFILSGRVTSSRANSLALLDQQISQLQSQSVLQQSAVQIEEVQQQNAVSGLDDAVLAADTLVIEENINTMLTWTDGGMSVTRDGAIQAYGLDEDSRVVNVFYINEAYSSAVDSVTVYCRRPNPELRSYACEVDWTITAADGITERRHALFLCSVNTSNELTALDAYLVP